MNLEKDVSSKRIDDLKRVHGIGPEIENRLHAAGVLTFSQLAALKPAEIATMLGRVGKLIGMSAERVTNQDWTGQASKLADETEEIEIEIDPPAPNGKMHYALFSIELLLDESNTVYRTRVLHTQSQTKSSWKNWDINKLDSFVTQNADLRFPQERMIGSLVIEPIKHEVPFQECENIKLSAKTVDSSINHPGKLIQPEFETGFSTIIVRDTQPFDLHINMNFTQVEMPSDFPVTYSATIYAKRLGNKSSQLVARRDGSLFLEDKLSLEIQGLQLSPGVYRIDEFVNLKTQPVGKW